MRLRLIPLAFLIPFLLAASSAPQVTHVILILHPADGTWQIQDADRITFNQKDKLRAGGANKTEVQPEEYKRFEPMAIMQAGMIRRHAAGYLVRKSEKGWLPILPDGLGLKAPTTLAEAWSSAAVSIQADKKVKNLTSIPVGDLFAILPGAARDQAVVSFLLDESNFRNLGEADAAAAFDEQLSLLASAARDVTGAPAAQLRQWLLAQMQTLNRKLSGGSAHLTDLDQGLKYAKVSEQAYPNDEAHKAVCASLKDKKTRLDQRVAILKALAAGELWDPLIEEYGKPLIETYGGFERWDNPDNPFDSIHQLWQAAFARSAADHKAAANRLLAKLPCQAKTELDMVLKLSPGDKEARVLLDDAISECENLGGHSCGKAEDPHSAEYRTVGRFLDAADSYANIGRLEEAEEQLSFAESRAKDSPRVLLARASLYQAAKKPLKALEVLDKYMRCASGEDADKGEKLRTAIKIQLEKRKKDLKDEIARSEAAGDYGEALSKVQEAVALDDSDPANLIRASIESAMNRKYEDAERFLNEYLRLPASNTGPNRSDVINLLPQLKPPAQPDGTPNWFSGYKNPPGLFYCPISLAPNARIREVRGSRKLIATWQWSGDRLSSVKTVVQQPNEPGFTVYFDYFKDGHAVRRVDKDPFNPKEDPPIPSFTPNGAVSKAQGTFVVLANHPLIDPTMVSRLAKMLDVLGKGEKAEEGEKAGKNVAVVVTGNPYFHPFAWSEICAFLVQYDDRNRIVSAAQLFLPEGKPPHILDFKWDGLKLSEIAERGGAYRRTMTYRGDRLAEEIVSYRGKNSKIEYKYTGDRLNSVRCDDDPTLENRSLEVTFY